MIRPFTIHNCHFTSVINWVIKLGAYKLSQNSFLSEAWTAIIDASIEWGNKKMLVVLGVQTSIMKNRSKALDFDDIEVVGVFVKETINSEVITNLLKPLFIKIGYPSQIVTDEGSEICGIYCGFCSLISTGYPNPLPQREREYCKASVSTTTSISTILEVKCA